MNISSAGPDTMVTCKVPISDIDMAGADTSYKAVKLSSLNSTTEQDMDAQYVSIYKMY